MKVQVTQGVKQFTPSDVKKFMDIRNHGFFRVANIVPKVFLANPMANAIEHCRLITLAYNEGACNIVCPELGASGYSVQDLFFDQTLQAANLEAVEYILKGTSKMNVVITIGAPLIFNHSIFNCAITFYQGKILAITPKLYPPNYREFYEGRHFARGSKKFFDTVNLLNQQDIPFGVNVLVESETVPNFVLHTQICEDGWVQLPPSAFAVSAGATVVNNVSASNITIDKDTARENMFSVDSMRWNCVYQYTAAGFGESTSDLAWDGHSFISNRGEVVKRNKAFEMNGSYILADVNLQLLSSERQRQTSFSQNADDMYDYLVKFRRVVFKGKLGTTKSKVFDSFIDPIERRPFVPDDPELRNKRCWQTFNMQASSLARRLLTLPEDHRNIVVGVSGGQDSTLSLLVAVHAIDLLGLPRTNIIGLTMPGYGTTKGSKADAMGLMETLGITWQDISILPMAEPVFEAIKHDMNVDDTTFENVQAWSRKKLELSMAAENKALDLGTGDLSESAEGYCTMYGDHASHYNPNSGVPKTWVTYLIRWAAKEIFGKDLPVKKILLSIARRAISAELKRLGKRGALKQKTEDIIGPYELIDFYLHHFVRFGLQPVTIARLALDAFRANPEKKLPERTLAEITKFEIVFIKRFFANQYKRNCVPDGVKIGLVSLSPRGDWRMPSDAEVKIWLENLDTIPVNVPA